MKDQQEDATEDVKRAFLWHLGTFAWVIGLLAIIDLALTGTDQVWVHWVAVIWGAILAVHFVDAFVLAGFLGFHGACWGGSVPRGERTDRQSRSA